MPQSEELAYASAAFRAIEINGTFYRLQSPETFKRWFDATPDGFVFAVKAPRFITHVKRLKEIAAPLANFMASGLLRLGRKLGPILWQLPPNFRFEDRLIADFLQRLPRNTTEAAHCARGHDAKLRTKPWLHPDVRQPLRHALEVRHDSFLTDDCLAMLREQGVALVCADSVSWPRAMGVTADFVYCRLHGAKELYRSGYDADAIDLWARRAKAWAAGRKPAESQLVAPDRHVSKPRDVFVFFDNTDKLRAPHDALALMERLGISRPQNLGTAA